MATPPRTYQQCLLIKNNLHKIALIPVKFAQLGKLLKIKEDGIWSNGWRVDKLYDKLLSDHIELITSTQRALRLKLTPY